MASGVSVNDDVVTQFNDFKLQKKPYDFRYFIYKIERDTEIVIESHGERSATYDDFKNAVLNVAKNDCRYALYDYDYQTDDGRNTSKIVFIAWAPDTAKIKSKMLYASSKEAIKRVLQGVSIQLSATDPSELEEENIKAKCK